MINPTIRPQAVNGHPANSPAEQPRPPRHHRGLFWVAVLAALAAVAGGALITATAYVSESEPQTAAVAYFHALGRGDAAGALGLGELPPGPRTYLTREVLDAALSIATITDVRVLAVVRHGDTAKVTVEYQLGSQQVSDGVSLVRHGRGWRLTRTAVPVHLNIAAGADRMSIAGARVPTATTLLFPGALPVALDTPNLDLGGLHVVHLDGAASQTLQPQVSAAGRRQVGNAVRAALQACLSGKVSSDCPPPAQSTAVPGSVRGRLAGDVAREVSIDVDPGAAGLLDISGNVIVNGSYQELDFQNQPVHRTGTLELAVRAKCYASAPSRLAWGAA